MKYKLFVGVFLTLVVTTATAGVKDKKAIRGADLKISEQVTKTKAACGNTVLEVKVSWDKFKTMSASNQEKLKSKGYQSQWVMSHAGDRTASTLEALSKICSSDIDYQEEISLLTKIVIVPKTDFEDSNNEFSLKGTVLTVMSGHRISRSYSDFIKPIKSLY